MQRDNVNAWAYKLRAKHLLQVNDRLRRRVAKLETENAELLVDAHEYEARIGELLARLEALCQP